ncbi:MAG: O-methyltransferase family 3 [Thermoleophilia bacterium]|jgi:caffeoyl-CoA O-methyltransferase|nr:O-methyltransferase family 3 [Thermoleophilia bacterium]
MDEAPASASAGAWVDGFGVVSPDVARYVEVLRPAPHDPLLLAMHNVARDADIELTDPDTATLVALLARTMRPERVVEAGTGIGFLTLHLARAVPADCTIISVEPDPLRQEQAHAFLARDDHRCAVELRLGEPTRALRDSRLPDIDMLVLTDCSMARLDLIDRLTPRLKPDGLLLVPNALLGGRVADTAQAWGGSAPDVEEQRVLNRSVATDPRYVDVTLLPVGDGLLLARRRT